MVNDVVLAFGNPFVVTYKSAFVWKGFYPLSKKKVTLVVEREYKPFVLKTKRLRCIRKGDIVILDDGRMCQVINKRAMAIRKNDVLTWSVQLCFNNSTSTVVSGLDSLIAVG